MTWSSLPSTSVEQVVSFESCGGVGEESVTESTIHYLGLDLTRV